MSNNNFRNFMNPLDIMPEDFYFDKVRPEMVEILSTIKFDPILLQTVEEVMNKADGSATKKDYATLQENFNPLSIVLLGNKSTYTKTDSFIRAEEEEKQLVKQFAKNIQELLTIITCTPKEKKEEKYEVRERLGYDEKAKENVIVENYDEDNQRMRLPNL